MGEVVDAENEAVDREVEGVGIDEDTLWNEKHFGYGLCYVCEYVYARDMLLLQSELTHT